MTLTLNNPTVLFSKELENASPKDAEEMRKEAIKTLARFEQSIAYEIGLNLINQPRPIVKIKEAYGYTDSLARIYRSAGLLLQSMELRDLFYELATPINVIAQIHRLVSSLKEYAPSAEELYMVIALAYEEELIDDSDSLFLYMKAWVLEQKEKHPEEFLLNQRNKKNAKDDEELFQKTKKFISEENFTNLRTVVHKVSNDRYDLITKGLNEKQIQVAVGLLDEVIDFLPEEVKKKKSNAYAAVIMAGICLQSPSYWQAECNMENKEISQTSTVNMSE